MAFQITAPGKYKTSNGLVVEVEHDPDHCAVFCWVGTLPDGAHESWQADGTVALRHERDPKLGSFNIVEAVN